MTLILGVEDPAAKRAYLLSDSGIWYGTQRSVIAQPKAWRAGEWLVGASGALSALQVVRHAPPPAPLENGSDFEAERILLEWWAELRPRLVVLASDLRAIDPNLSDSGDMPGLVVAHDCRVWSLHAGAVRRTTDGYEASGSVRPFAVAAMAALNTVPNLTPLERAKRTQSLAREHTDWAHGPTLILCTNGSEGTL